MENAACHGETSRNAVVVVAAGGGALIAIMGVVWFVARRKPHKPRAAGRRKK